MTGRTERICGIRLRRPDGRKYAVRGGREGLFIPSGLVMTGLMLIAEGPTDTAALLDLGYSAVGRPSCTGGVRLLTELVHRNRPSGLVVVADADVPGQAGAGSLARALALFNANVRVITPTSPAKDIRDWLRSGATAKDIARAVAAATPVRTSVTLRSTRR